MFQLLPKTNTVYILGGCFIIFLIIGACFLAYGCDKRFMHSCKDFDILSVMVYTYIENYVIFTWGINHFCKLFISVGNLSQMVLPSIYPMNTTFTLYREKYTNDCYDNLGGIEILANFGLAFFIFCGLMLIWFVTSICYVRHRFRTYNLL